MFRLHSRSGRESTRRLGLGVATAAVLLAVAAPAAPGAPFVYVTGGWGSDDAVFQFDAGPGGLLSPLAPPSVVADQRPHGVAVSPDGSSLYVTNAGAFEDGDPGGRDEGDTVSQFTIGAGGSLSPKSPPAVAAGDLPGEVAVSPDGKSAYVPNAVSHNVSQYDVDADGNLLPKSPATVPANGGRAVAVSPDGISVYVAAGSNEVFGGDNTIYQYDVGLSGALSPKSPPTVDAGLEPIDLAVSPDGKSVYVVNCCVHSDDVDSFSISQYEVDSSGKLSPKSPPSVPAPTHHSAIAVSPDGESAYVTDSGSGSGGRDRVLEYDVGPNGALVLRGPPRAATGKYPGDVAVSPDGESVYVANGGNYPSPPFGSVSQYDVGASGGLSPKSPATVAAGRTPTGIALSPPAKPTTKDQCKHGGWREFGFKSKRNCIRFVKRQARQACRAEREEIGRKAFRKKYGKGKHHRHAMRNCVKQAIGAR